MKALALAVVLGGCTLTGAGEGLEQATCAGEPASFCAELNDLAPTGDACQSWKCDTTLERPVCAVLPLDADLDGSPARDCNPPGVAADCDDADAERTPGAAEVCDGVDNDCDTAADEGAWTASAPRALVDFGADPMGDVANLAVAAAPVGAPVALAVTANLRTVGNTGAPRLATLATLAPESAVAPQAMVVRSGPDEFTPVSRGTGVFFDSAGDLFGLLAEPSGGGGNGRLFAGELVSQSTRAELTVSPAHFTDGFAASGPSSYVATSTNFARTRAAVAFVAHAATPSDPCGQLGANAHVTGIDVSGTLATATSSLAVGEHVDPSPPALVAVSDSQWLVATAAATQVELRTVTLVAAAAPSVGPLVHAEPATMAGQLALAFDGEDVVLAWRDGCAASATLRARAFSWSGAGLAALGEVTELAPGGTVALVPERPSISPIDALGGWWVVWTRGDAAVVASRLAPRGALVEELVLWDSATVRFGVDLVADGAGLAAIAYDEANGNVLRASTLSCAAP